MADFSFNIEDELADIRPSKKQEVSENVTPTEPLLTESVDVGDVLTTDPVDWKQFKTMPGVFEPVIGGNRPVQLHKTIPRVQVSNVPKPLLHAVQERLQRDYLGVVIGFPWGDYTITERNRVFTARASLIRYLLFDSFRDEKGTHVQYAKQWLALQHPAFDAVFNPTNQLNPSNDELDIYALLYASHMRALQSGEYNHHATPVPDDQTIDRLGMLNKRMDLVLETLHTQEKTIHRYESRNHLLQTVLLLDRMGLLKGGLPKDVGAFIRVLELNRDVLAETGEFVDKHLQAEEKRQETLARSARMKSRNAP